jgi:HEAT repeat protein
MRRGEGAEAETIMKSLRVVCLLAASVFLPGNRFAAAAAQDRQVTEQKPLSAWIEDLKDADCNTHVRAAEAIGRLGPSAKSAVPALRAILKNRSGEVPGYAAVALWKVDAAGFTEIVKDKDHGGRERWAAILGLSNIGPAAKDLTPLVLKIATDKADSANREHALLALGYIGAAPTVAVPVLTDALQDEQAQYAWMLSAQALGQFGPKAKEALPVLYRVLRDPDPQVRVDAAGAVWKIERQPQRVMPVLTDALNGMPSDGSAARQRAVHYLAAVGPRAREAFPKLLTLWKISTGSLRTEVAAALKSIDVKAATDVGIK